MDRLIVLGLAGLWIWSRRPTSGSGGVGSGGGSGGGSTGELVSSSVRWDPPVDGEGRGRRMVGMPSGFHLVAETRGAKVWGLRTVEAATGREVARADGLPVPADGVIRLDDLTPVPATYGLGRHRVELILDGKIHPLGGHPEVLVVPSIAGGVSDDADVITIPEPPAWRRIGEIPELPGMPAYPQPSSAFRDDPFWRVIVR